MDIVVKKGVIQRPIRIRKAWLKRVRICKKTVRCSFADPQYRLAFVLHNWRKKIFSNDPT